RWVLDRGHRRDDPAGADGGSVVVQRTDIHAAKLIERTQHYLARVDLPESPAALLRDLARFVAQELAVGMVLIGRLDEAQENIEVVADSRDGGAMSQWTYRLADTPCANVSKGDFCLFASGVCGAFPADTWLAENGIESYGGMPLFEPGGRCVGLIAFLHRQPLEGEPGIEPVLRLVAVRAAAELRRMHLATDLWNKEQLLKGLFENMPSVCYVKDRDSRLLLMNDEFCRTIGLTREQAIGRSNHEIFPEVYASAMRASDVAALESRGAVRVRDRLGLADGVHEFASTKFALRDEAGAAYAVAGISVDITDQDRAERALRDSEEKFRGLFQAARDAIMLLDPTGRCCDCNESAASLFGSSTADLIGRNVIDLSPPRQPGGADSATEGRRLLGAGCNGSLPAFDWRHRGLDGRDFDCEVSLSSVQWQGRHWLIAIQRDVTERRRVQHEHQLLHAATQATPAGIAITDATGVIEWVNAAFMRLTGYRLEEVQGRSTRLLSSGRHPPEFYRRMWETILRGDIWTGELTNRRKDGSTFNERMTIAPVRDDQGRIRNFVAIKEDITAEQRMEQQLAQAQRLESVGMLASGIAHDLNNVLTPIILSVELLKSMHPSPELHERLDLVARAAHRGADIVKQVLTFARGADGERTTTQPRYVVKEVARLIEETFPRQIEVRVETGRDTAPILADVTQLHQVILNLAVNARDAMPTGGRLILGVRAAVVDETRARLLGRIEPGEFVDISVTDTGTGIPDEVLAHMFEPFYTTKPRGKGTGLGLSTVYGIVRSHGGAVEVQTELGRGTTFHVLLPIPRTPDQERGAEAAGKEFRGRGHRVLLVDDEESIRIVGEHMLQQFGFEVVTAADGIHALGLFQRQPADFAAAIVDQMMPRMGGLALIRELRSLAPGLKVISSTGLGAEPGEEQAEAEELARLGVRTRLSNPYTGADLIDALRRELDEA
ncbi:MAG: PAS domain S-box protein, partial [Candidatus Didemnitutus sp.]|nr:PAS domain S-box protein [Candidatus Didemnitutus sp.]